MIHEKVPVLAPGLYFASDTEIAERWGVLDAERQLVGRLLNIADGMIAAAALKHGLTLVTRNLKDFAQLGSLYSIPGTIHDNGAGGRQAIRH